MSVFDSTVVDLAARGATGTPPATGGETPPATDGKETPGASDARPQSSDLVTGILDKHGLGSPEELAEFIDSLVGLKGKIGDHDPEELLKARETLEAYHHEWAKKEREKLRENETPEDTIKRLEKELKDEQTRKAKNEQKARKAESAKQALKTYADVVGSAIASDTTIPAEYRPFLMELMGVDSPVNTVNILDRAGVRKLTKEHGIKLLKDFEQLVIKRYRDGKAEIPVVPPAASGNPPVTGEAKPKNLNEGRQLAKAMLTKLWGNR